MSIFIRVINTQIPPYSQMFLRYILSFLLSVWFLKSQRVSLKTKTTSDLILFLISGFLGYTLSTIFFTFAILSTSIATTLFIFSTNIVLTPVLEAVFLKEKLSRKLLLAMLLSLIGTAFLFKPDFSGGFIGSIWAFLMSISVSIYYVCRRKLKTYPSAVAMTYSTAIAVVILGFLSLIFEYSFYTSSTSVLSEVSPFIWLVMGIFALDNFASWYLVNKGFQTVSGGIGSIILLIEPLLGVGIGISLYHEALTLQMIMGIAITLAGILLVVVRD